MLGNTKEMKKIILDPWSHGIYILTGTKIWRKMTQWLAEYANTQSAPDR